LGVEFLTDSVFVLRFERDGLDFIPGQRLLIGRGMDMREYSIFSAPEDPFLEILVKRIEGGAVSPLLAGLSPGDEIEVKGPAGDFFLATAREDARHLFVASGTGISPYRCFVRSTGALDYLVLHGVRYPEERYCRDAFQSDRYVACVSKGTGPDFVGRVSDLLRLSPVESETECYLCGNSDMIYECFRILSGYGVPRERIHAEIYF
jgi:ferredoxin--NADP+ reductase/benzoate/toluate 1,2-dioxygenase reductase subunit